MRKKFYDHSITIPIVTSAIATRVRSLILFAIVCVVTMAAHAQYNGSIRGVVTDPQGAVVPGATVTLTNADTGQKQISTSSSDGIYNFNALPPAHFTITVEKDGFKKKLLPQVQIIPEQLNSINLQMEPGDVETTVTVQGTTQGLDSQTATVSATVNSNQIQHLPSFNRDIFQLAQLTPGNLGSAAPDGTVSPNSDFGVVGEALGSRTVQIQARFSF